MVTLSGRAASRDAARYWSLPARGRGAAHRGATGSRDAERALRAAVESHLVSDVPVGAFLSGGVDSGLMVAMMADILGGRSRPSPCGFPNAGAAFIDEQQLCQRARQRYRLNHHEIEVTPDLEGIADEIVQAFDQPFADDSVIPTYYVSQVARAARQGGAHRPRRR